MAKYKVKFKEGYQDLGAYALLLNIIEKGGLEVEIVGGAYSKEVLTLPVPGSGDTVSITTTNRDTIVTFDDFLDNDFNLNITSGPDTEKGDRVYIMLKSSNSSTVYFGGQINDTQCGSPDGSYEMGTDMICIELIYDGANFTGIDIC